MILDLCDEAVEFGRAARGAIEGAGGDELVQRIEIDPARREDVLAPVFAALGAWQLDPRGSPEELEAAAALCRVFGYWAVPYPVAERLSRPSDADADGLVVVAGSRPVGPVAHLDLRWVAVDLDASLYRVWVKPPTGTPRENGFVTDLGLTAAGVAMTADVALGLTLPCWVLLGMLDRVMELTRAYVLERQQFGQPLSSFQGVQFQLTDCEVERAGVEELAKYTLWSVGTDRAQVVEDALALRAAAIEAAEVVFRVGHQLHGAIGFCDESPLSWISRYSNSLRRRPLGLSATKEELTRRLGRRGLAGLFASDAE